jgi:hypothetical protein
MKLLACAGLLEELHAVLALSLLRKANHRGIGA